MSLESTSAPPPTLATSDKPQDEGSKLRTLLSILRRFIGVADIAAVRFSLPAQLLEPTPNLEYWNYLDRPETFVSIGDSNDAVERMLAVLRFWFTKDLKYVKGKPCKPYNSTLGEFFRCKWEVPDAAPSIVEPAGLPVPEGANDASKKPVTVSYLTEQTSHHPPISAFYIDCPERGISARGFDQLSAKFTGTSVKVTPGTHNLGIFIALHRRGEEEYQLTHPAAQLGGSLSVSVADLCYITCPKTRLKVILNYAEEGWLGRAQNKVTGIIFQYDPEHDTRTKIKDVPGQEILARIEGCWQEKMYYSLAGSSEKSLLVDLSPLFPVPKIIPPEEQQLPNESRRFWHDLTHAILSREYGRATNIKQQLEEGQREKAAARKANGEEWRPRFFTAVTEPSGRPDLTPDGQIALRGLQEGQYVLEPSLVTGA
ncbi:MAG: hypothetical protein M1815_005371 [Lichina confinis]|nr:MAG: hypothetical protein M1815_005371 [Lichina confinis]